MNTYQTPYTGNFKITSPFGERIHPISGKKSFHKGIDFSMPEETKLFAPFPGRLTHHINRGGASVGFGNYVMLIGERENGDPLKLILAHLSAKRINNNENALKGSLIAFSGNSGSSTGAHLHLQMELWNNTAKEWIEFPPEDLIDFGEVG